MAARKKRDWEALENRVAIPEGWDDWPQTERQLFLLVRGASPAISIKEMADELDLSLAETVEMIDRREMRTTKPPARVPVGDFLKLIETAAKKVITAMDSRKIEDADLKSLGAVFRDLINTRAVLLNEPTVIVGVDHRRAMNDAVQMVIAEAMRRGMGISTDPHGSVLVRRPAAIDVQSTPVKS